MHFLDLVDLGRIDIELRDAPGARRKIGRIARNPVVEARAHGDQEVAVFDRVVGEGRAVHAEHAHRQGMRGIEHADAHQRRYDRNVELRSELTQRFGGIAIDRAATDV